MYFFTADEHYGHASILEYCNRPFTNVDEMDEALVKRHNEVVSTNDTVVHVGDFSMLNSRARVEAFIHRLNGDHIFIKGSHDYWLDKPGISFEYGPEIQIWEKGLSLVGKNFYIVACHYAMRVWPKAYHGAWQLYGHSHGKMAGIGPQMDVGVDTNNFYPYSLEDIAERMKNRPALADSHHKNRTKKKYGW